MKTTTRQELRKSKNIHDNNIAEVDILDCIINCSHDLEYWIIQAKQKDLISFKNIKDACKFLEDRLPDNYAIDEFKISRFVVYAK